MSEIMSCKLKTIYPSLQTRGSCGILTFVAAPVVVTGAAIVGTAWGVGQLVAGDEINGWIDNNFGYR